MHGLSVRVRVELKVHKFKDGKPLCGQQNPYDKDDDLIMTKWRSLSKHRCKKCERIIKRSTKHVKGGIK